MLLPLICLRVTAKEEQTCSDQPTGQLAGALAVVTGASRGVGAEIARVYAREGAFVAVNYFQSKEKADTVVAEINSKHGCARAFAVYGDVTQKEDMISLVAATEKHFGKRVR